MNNDVISLVVQACWYVLVIVWAVGAFTAKRQVRSQPTAPRLAHVLALLIGGLLVFTPRFDRGVFAQEVLPRSETTALAGLVLTVLGIAFAIWARFFLGTNWSATPGVQQGHHLVRRGPYAIVRHPIYSGLLLALLGTALLVDKWRCLVGLAIIAGACHIKSRTEERYMEEQFGGEYARYRREVKALIPFVL